MAKSIESMHIDDEHPSGVKVTHIETLPVGGLTFVRVHTNEGITGLGEMHPASSTSGGRYIPPAAIRFHEEYLIGKDPTQIERHWQHMFRRSLFRGGSDPMAESAERLVAEGFSVVRMFPLGSRERFAEMGFRTAARTAEKFVAAVRNAVGDDIDIAIDVICLLTPAEAIETGRLLAPYGLMFFEDPIEPDNIDAMSHVASRLPMPVATGERLCTIHQFRDLLNKNAAAFLRPDPALAGGITNVRKIAALAEANYIELIPHNPLSWVNAVASLHLCASVQNVAMLEHHIQGNVLESAFDEVFTGIPTLENGHLVVPDRPGLGIELNDEALKAYPPTSGQRPPVIRPDGSLRDY